MPDLSGALLPTQDHQHALAGSAPTGIGPSGVPFEPVAVTIPSSSGLVDQPAGSGTLTPSSAPYATRDYWAGHNLDVLAAHVAQPMATGPGNPGGDETIIVPGAPYIPQPVTILPPGTGQTNPPTGGGSPYGATQQEVALAQKYGMHLGMLGGHVVIRKADGTILNDDGVSTGSNGMEQHTVQPITLKHLEDRSADMMSSLYGHGLSDDDRSRIGGGLNAGKSLSDIRTDETKNPAVAGEVKSIFRDALDRDADPGGLQTYLNALANGSSITQVRGMIAQSPEAHSVLGGVITAVQNRAPNSGDETWIQGNQAFIQNGGSVAAARSALIDNGGETGVVNQIYINLHGHGAVQADYDYARQQMHGGLTIQQYVWNEAHTADAANVLRATIHDIQNRDANQGDTPWIQGNQDNLGHQIATQQTIRDGLIDYGGETGVVDVIYSSTHNRAAVQADYDYARQQMHGGLSIQQYVWNEAHTEDVANGLRTTIHDIRGWNASQDDNPLIQSWEDDIGHQIRSQQDIRSQLIDDSGETGVIGGRYTDIHNHAATQADYDYARWRMHTGWTIQQYINDEAHSPAVRVSLNTLQQSVVGTGAGHEFQAWNAWAMDAKGQGNLTYAGARANIANAPSTSASLNSLQDLMFGKAPGQEFQPWNDWAKGQLASGDQTLSSLANGLAQNDQAKAQVQSFLITTKLGDPNNAGLMAGGQTMLTGMAMAYQRIKDYSADELNAVAHGSINLNGVGHDLLSNLLPHDTVGWLGLAGLIALELTPPGEAVTAGALLAIGGERLAVEGLHALESRLVSDIETRTVQVISEDSKQWAVEDFAEQNAQHAIGHIDGDGELSLNRVGIKTKKDLSNYIRDTINNAPNNPNGYEILSDAPRDRLAIWDKDNGAITIFNPKTSSRDLNQGSTFRPKNGYSFVEDFKNGR